MKTFVLINALAVLVAGILLNVASAADKNSTYFRQTSALVYGGFDGPACNKLPMPHGFVDGEDNCLRLPNTYLYKLTKDGSEVVREVRELTATIKSSKKGTTAVDGRDVVMEETFEAKDSRSVWASFGRRQNFSLKDITGFLSSAESASAAARIFSSGMAASQEGGKAREQVEVPVLNK